MSRILAIDYGGKRCGIAVTDESQIIASGLTTVDTNDLITWLTDYVSNEDVELFIVGEPKRLHGAPSESEKLIQPFLKKLNDILPDIP